MGFWSNNPFPQMGAQGFVSMDPEVALEVLKEVTPRMLKSARAAFVALVDKERERTRLMTMNQRMRAEEEPKEKFVDEFMVFLAAIDDGDLQTLQRFDEKDMMNTILKMRNSDAGDEGGLEFFYGDEVSKTGFGLDEKAVIDTTLATVKTDGSCGRAGGFAGEYGGDFPKTKLGLEEKAMVKNNGSCGGSKGGFTGDYEREEAVAAAVEKPNSDDNGLEAEASANVVAAANETAQAE